MGEFVDGTRSTMTTIDVRSNRIALASGMVSVQGDCTVDEALVKMSEYAAVMRQTLEEVAAAVVEHRVDFSG
jgi:hypothetical protein